MGKSQTHAAKKSGPSSPTRGSVAKPAMRSAGKRQRAVIEAQPVEITPEERHRRIAEAAYYRALRRGFHGGADLEDWLESEAEIDRLVLRL
jgi:hypothetical protein